MVDAHLMKFNTLYEHFFFTTIVTRKKKKFNDLKIFISFKRRKNILEYSQLLTDMYI